MVRRDDHIQELKDAGCGQLNKQGPMKTQHFVYQTDHGRSMQYNCMLGFRLLSESEGQCADHHVAACLLKKKPGAAHQQHSCHLIKAAG